jgi:hypothetical protein
MADSNADYYIGGSLYSGPQSPRDANYYGSANFTNVNVANIRYYQRVLSSGLNVWCYYDTLNAVDPAPLPAATSPNWTGSISDSQVVAAVPVP